MEGSLFYLFEILVIFVNKIKLCKKFKVIMWIFENNDVYLLIKIKLKCGLFFYIVWVGKIIVL